MILNRYKQHIWWLVKSGLEISQTEVHVKSQKENVCFTYSKQNVFQVNEFQLHHNSPNDSDVLRSSLWDDKCII